MRLRGFMRGVIRVVFVFAFGQRRRARFARFASHSKNSATVSSRVMRSPRHLCNYLADIIRACPLGWMGPKPPFFQSLKGPPSRWAKHSLPVGIAPILLKKFRAGIVFLPLV